jgi:hypothetical protein
LIGQRAESRVGISSMGLRQPEIRRPGAGEMTMTRTNAAPTSDRPIPRGTFFGSDLVPPGTFHASDRVPPRTLHRN